MNSLTIKDSNHKTIIKQSGGIFGSMEEIMIDLRGDCQEREAFINDYKIEAWVHNTTCTKIHLINVTNKGLLFSTY